MDRGESAGAVGSPSSHLGLSTGELAKTLRDGELILICDIGGGTTDFSLVRAHLVDGELQFERTAIGEHLLLGGDNLDFALARREWKRSSRRSSLRCGSVMRYAGPAVRRKSGC